MRFEAAEVLDLVGISKEMLRHWKKALPPIFGRDARSSRYSFEEVVALAVIARAVRDFAVPVSHFTYIAEKMFNEVGRHLQPPHVAQIVCITRNDVLFAPLDSVPDHDCMVIVHLERLLVEIRANIEARGSQEAQLDLPLAGAKIAALRGLRFR